MCTVRWTFRISANFWTRYSPMCQHLVAHGVPVTYRDAHVVENLADVFFQAGDIPEFRMQKTGGQGLKALVEFRLPGRGHRCQRAAMKRTGKPDSCTRIR